MLRPLPSRVPDASREGAHDREAGACAALGAAGSQEVAVDRVAAEGRWGGRVGHGFTLGALGQIRNRRAGWD